MKIDIHAHAAFFKEICGDAERVALRREHVYLYKQNIWPMSLFMTQLNAAGLDKAVLLAEDLTTTVGQAIVSNEEVKQLVDLEPERLIGFAAVDPKRSDAIEVLEKAFGAQNMAGLRLNPASQRFMPNDDALMKPIYECCIKHNKPILFDAGMSWIKNAPSKYSQPLVFEDVALEYPDLRICLAHYGWPWIMDTTMLLLKYPNVYADTALLYFDSPKQFFQTTFNVQMGEYWIDRMLADKVIFGSNYPRIEQKRMVQAVDTLTLRPQNKAKVMGENARRFLGMEG
ncbi:MAG TPA: amidohydrolase [Clostridiales bacterium]|nr:amidohydrolase [Clostridiales bacterium]